MTEETNREKKNWVSHCWVQKKMTTRISHGAHAWFKNLLDSVIRACPTCIILSSPTKRQKTTVMVNSGFPSTRINLSPFTKDFRGGEHLNESID